MLLEQALTEAETEVRWAPAPLLTTAGRKALAAFKSGGIVVFDVDRASDILQVIAFSERHGLNSVISGGTEAWMVADQLAEAGVPVLINTLSNLPESFDQLGARLDNAALLNEAGVTFSFMGAGTHDARRLRQMAGNAVANGLPYEAGLAAMTVSPAVIFALGDDHGSLESNSVADLVIWSGDPLEVTSAADQVIIAGKMVEMVSRQTLLRDRYLPENPDLPRAYIKP
jgi:imidazolonepropionase-like amidohydrolase